MTTGAWMECPFAWPLVPFGTGVETAIVAEPFVSASTTCKECPDNGPRAWPRISEDSITDVAPCSGASRDSNGSTDAMADAFDSTSDRGEMLVPVARLLPDAGDTITGSIAHMRRRLKSPGGLIDRMGPEQARDGGRWSSRIPMPAQGGPAHKGGMRESRVVGD